MAAAAQLNIIFCLGITMIVIQLLFNWYKSRQRAAFILMAQLQKLYKESFSSKSNITHTDWMLFHENTPSINSMVFSFKHITLTNCINIDTYNWLKCYKTDPTL
jgi:hypothetical protein